MNIVELMMTDGAGYIPPRFVAVISGGSQDCEV